MSDAFDQGITVTELAPMDLPIAVDTETTAAFVGRALRGPLNTPVLIHSYAEFRRRFGGIWHRSSLGPAVEQYFEHGGSRLYVVRVANNARGAMIALPARGGVLVLRAYEPGSTETVRASVDYDAIDESDDEHFNLVVQRVSPDTGLVVDQEIFRRVSCSDESRSNVAVALSTSGLVRANTPLPKGRPLATVASLSNFEDAYVTHAQPGTDGNDISDYDLIGSPANDTGVFALNAVEHFDLLYLPPPAQDRDPGPAAILAAERFCRRRGAMLIMDPPASWTDVRSAIDGVRRSGYASPNILGYFPRVLNRRDPERKARVAGAAIAGLLGKLDRRQGPWEDLDQVGFGLSRNLVPAASVSAADAHLLVREGLNVIAGNTAGRAAVCGSVTLGRGSQMDRRFSSLTVRRLCLKITNAIEYATRWAVFEPDGRRVSDRVLGQVDAYLASLADLGAFADGRYVVHYATELGSETSDPERGLTIMLAFRPTGTEEEITLTIQQTIAGCRVAVTAFAPVTAEVA